MPNRAGAMPKFRRLKVMIAAAWPLLLRNIRRIEFKSERKPEFFCRRDGGLCRFARCSRALATPQALADLEDPAALQAAL